jgi:hypothetical protein
MHMVLLSVYAEKPPVCGACNARELVPLVFTWHAENENFSGLLVMSSCPQKLSFWA